MKSDHYINGQIFTGESLQFYLAKSVVDNLEGFKVVDFKVWPVSMTDWTNDPNGYNAGLQTDDTIGGPDATSNEQMAWAWGSGLGRFQDTTWAAERIIIDDLFMFCNAGGYPNGLNFKIRLERVKLTRNQQLIVMIKNRSQTTSTSP